MSLAKAMKKFAEYHHRNQRRDFSGEPYRNHLERVAFDVVQHIDEIPDINTSYDADVAEAIAWGHDLIEDTKKNPEVVTYDVILTEFGDKNLADGILDLTNVYTTEDFPELNRKARKILERDRIAQIPRNRKAIKMCDRKDNITSYEREDPDWGKDHFYISETELLLTALVNVHSGLYNAIREVIQTAKRGPQ